MKKIMIACLASEQQSAVTALQSLGTVHVVNLEEPSSKELDEAKRSLDQLSRALTVLRNERIKPAETPAAERPPEEIVEEALQAMETKKRCDDELASLRQQMALLSPWGSFSTASLEQLAARGLHIALCSAPVSRLPQLPEGCALHIVSQTHGTAYFAVLSMTSLDDLDLPLAQLPKETDLKVLHSQEADALRRQQNAQNVLALLAANGIGPLEQYEQQLSDKLDFIKARDGMATTHVIACLGGYVPADKVDELRHCARTYGWAIHYEEVPEDDQEAPTHLIIPKPFRMAQWIFDFVGILPGYHETDVSISMLVFLSIFCGILVGDAGYGVLFTAAVLYFRSKVKEERNRQGMNLLLVMSLSILVYGALTGTWFALDSARLPRFMRGLPWLTNSETAQDHIQIICFFLGALHMSMARVWRAIQACTAIDIHRDGTWAFLGKVRDTLGHLSWGLFLWANYGMAKLMIVDGGSVEELPTLYRSLYLIGGVSILLFSINWTEFGDVIYIPFTYINSFVDLLSYIRLFAVGLSSAFIARAFNDMAAGLCSDNPWLIPASMLIVLAGHLLNVALACMGVLVHGIRLNTLEFSGHMGIGWGGKAYKPLKKN